MMRSMYASVSGLKVHQTKMDIIGNNIANINTLGYKGSRATFKETLAQTMKGATAPNAEQGSGGTNPVQVGLGVTLGSVDTDMSSGNLQPTGKQSDVAIQGDGFFVVNNGKQDYYTRAGSFSFDKQGYLFSSANGYRVRGWVANEDGQLVNIGPDNVSDIVLDKTMNPTLTENISYVGNLNMAQENLLSFNPNKVKITTDDGSGNSISDNLTMEFAKTEDYNRFQFDLAATDTASNFLVPTDLGGTLGEMTITSNPSAELNGYQIRFADTSDAAGVDSVSIDLDNKVITVDANFDNSGGGSAPALGDITTAINTELTNQGIEAEITDITNAAYDPDPATGNSAELADKSVNVSTNVLSGFLELDADGNIISITDEFGHDVTGNLDFSVKGTTAVSLELPADTDNIDTTPFLAEMTGITDMEEMKANYELKAQRTVSVDIYDSMGKQHNVNFTFVKTDHNQWLIREDSVGITDGLAPAEGFLGGNSHQITFDELGNVVDGENLSLSFDPFGGLGTQTIEVDLSKITQFAGNMTVDFENVDGYPQGEFQSMSIDTAGNITGSFSNGQSKVLGKVALAMFSNPSGLSREGGLLSVSNNSGQPRIGIPGISGRGSLAPGSLEMSNVDLSEQFTEMISAQRGFQASSKLITTSDEMLQQLVNLKR